MKFDWIDYIPIIPLNCYNILVNLIKNRNMLVGKIYCHIYINYLHVSIILKFEKILCWKVIIINDLTT